MSLAEAARLAHRARCLLRVVMAETPDEADRHLTWLELMPEVRKLTTADEGAMAFGSAPDETYVVWRRGSRYTSQVKPDWLHEDEVLHMPPLVPTPKKSLHMLAELAAQLQATAPDRYEAMSLDEKLGAVRAYHSGDASRSVRLLVDETFEQMLQSCDLESQPEYTPSKEAVAAWLSHFKEDLNARYIAQSLSGGQVVRLLAAAEVHLNSFKSEQALLYRFVSEHADLNSPVGDLRAISYEVAIDGTTQPTSHRFGFAEKMDRPLPEPTVTYVFPFQLNAYIHARELMVGAELNGVLDTADALKDRADLLRDAARQAITMEEFNTLLYAALVVYKEALYLYREIAEANGSQDASLITSITEGDTVCEEMRVLILSTFLDSVDSTGVDFMDVGTFGRWVTAMRELPDQESSGLISDKAVKLKCPMFVTELARCMIRNQNPNTRLQALDRLQKLLADILEARRADRIVFGEPNYLGVACSAVAETLRLLGREEEARSYDGLGW